MMEGQMALVNAHYHPADDGLRATLHWRDHEGKKRHVEWWQPDPNQMLEAEAGYETRSSPIQGTGIFATVPRRKGEILGLAFRTGIHPAIATDFFKCRKGWVTRTWLCRWMNHQGDKEANVMGWHFKERGGDMLLVAQKVIVPEEELLVDYWPILRLYGLPF